MKTQELEELIFHLAESGYAPDVRAFIEQHPLHLMVATGQETPEIHVQAMQEMLAQRTMLWTAPRGFGKTTLTLFYCAWLAIAEPDNHHPSIGNLFPGAPERVGPSNIRIALISATAEAAETLLFSIRALLQRPIVDVCFGNLVGTDRWRTRAADTSLRDSKRKEATFSTLSIGASIAGGHYEFAVLDDLYHQSNSANERAREHVRQVFFDVILPTLRSYGRMLLLGTRWHREDLAHTLMLKERDGEWGKVLVTRAIVDGEDGKEESAWPGGFSIRALRARRREMGSAAFEAQYLMNPGGLGGGMFQREWLETYGTLQELPVDQQRGAVTCIGIDPAVSLGERADHTAIVVATCVDERYYISECQRGKWTFRQTVEKTRQIARRYRNVRWVVVEATQAQAALVRDFRRYAPELPVRGQLPERMPGKSKEGRAMAFVHLFETHPEEPDSKVFFAPPTEENGIKELQQEMSVFPFEKGPDDAVDALIYSLHGFTVTRTRLLRLDHHRRQRRHR